MTSQPFLVFDLVFPNRQAFADVAITKVKFPGQDPYQATLA
jgi:hypothetical protein